MIVHFYFLFQPIRRNSLTPPPECNVTWKEYINTEPGQHPKLGRELVYKESNKTFRATVGMVILEFLFLKYFLNMK